jgi:hypothetical protein
LHDNIGSAEYGSTIRHNLRALFDIHRVGIAGLLAGPCFDNDLEPGFDEVGNDYGNKRNATLSGITFFRNSYDHAAVILSVPTRRCRGLGVSGSARL